ncbi:DNA replication regulator SLD3-domain-containing protein [Lipomyces tetrasporus]|uniref:DNA replication regulator SLD3-domain-containing protein n=1 Tax=Lipomyces tetrasporus TaxID=54092 RepID=A0AAD7QNN8_9ASCO|nr:DNA replication regulator SLD3-domain-containing protein [Lipomyces tetrasporus]KAJ8098370.1 DNA replication regulator SLD3-domain-containing protein [Lipomyces tetrasporus]
MSGDALGPDAHVEDELVLADVTAQQNAGPPLGQARPVPQISSPPTRRKRKYVETAPEYMKPFVIHPFQQNALSPPLSITPIKAAPREYVPISILASITSPSISSSSTKMEKFHDLCHPMTKSRPFEMRLPGLGNKVLFVKIEEGKSLAAIEKVGEDVYMLTVLPDHVKVKHIRTMWKTSRSTSGQSLASREKLSDVCMRNDDESIPDYTTLDEDFDGYWRGIGVEFAEPRIPNPAVASLLESFSMVPPTPAEGASEKSASQTSMTTTSASPTTVPLPALKDLSTRELLKHMQAMYFEVLYVSKSPLTYFAKLTLARFRTLCKDNPEKIVEVLQQMILTVGESDYKYKSGLPNILLELENAHGMDEVTIGLFNPENPSSEISIPAIIAQSMVGLRSLDHEKHFVQRWWNMEEDVRLPKSRAKRVDEIKKRETKLQAILALEILAQQHSRTTEAADPAADDTRTKVSAKKKRPTKHDMGPNLNLLLDVLFDRLYIWQTVSSLDFIIATSKQQADEVREFCLEVIVPFYGSRLPKQTQRLLKKCGGEKSSIDAPSSPTAGPSQSKKVKQEEGFSPIAPSKNSRSKSRSTTAPNATVRGLSSSILKCADLRSDLNTKGRKPAAARGGLLVSKKTLERRQIDITTKK